ARAPGRVHALANTSLRLSCAADLGNALLARHALCRAGTRCLPHIEKCPAANLLRGLRPPVLRERLTTKLISWPAPSPAARLLRAEIGIRCSNGISRSAGQTGKPKTLGRPLPATPTYSPRLGLTGDGNAVSGNAQSAASSSDIRLPHHQK